MTDHLNCQCGNPGSVDARDGDDRVRCVPCRREWRRLHVEPSHVEAVIARREAGHQSGDPIPARESRRLHVQLTAARVLVDRATALLPAGLDAIQLLTVDGYPTKAPGAAPAVGRYVAPPEGECPEPGCDCERPCPEHDAPLHLNAVESAAMSGLRVAGIERKLDQSVKAIAVNALQVVQLLEKVGRLAHPPEQEQMCNRGVGREGHLEWQDPLCARHFDPTKAGMCDECWEAEARWREARGLPPRERTDLTPPQAGPTCVRDGCIRAATPGRTDGLCGAHRVADLRAARKAAR